MSTNNNANNNRLNLNLATKGYNLLLESLYNYFTTYNKG